MNLVIVESPAKAKAKILEGDEGKQFKTDHFEKTPKPNPSHVYSTAATVKPDTPLTSTARAMEKEHHGILVFREVFGVTNEIGAIH